MALEEFIFARSSGRLIAFVGSYATKHMGYPDWKGLLRAFLDACDVDEKRKPILDSLKARSQAPDGRFAAPDLMDMAELLAGRDRHADPAAFLKGRKDFADHNFRPKGRVEEAFDRPNIGAALFSNLGISRTVTLNYDLELEWEAFLTDHDRQQAKTRRRWQVWLDTVARLDCNHALLERHVPGRGKVVSEVLQRDDSAQLIEFALGAPEDHCRILHLHGRVDCPESMLVSRRDYRDRYWQDGFSKLPFEYGLRMIFSGNPILFVGIGMTEGEVTQTLEQMLSDNPNRRAVPMFLLWNASDDRGADDVMRLLFNRKFGVHVLFDREVASAEEMAEDQYRTLVTAPLGGSGTSEMGPLTAGALQEARRLEEPLKLLGKRAKAHLVDDFWKLEDFRNPQVKYEGDPCRVNMWHYNRPEAPVLTCEARDPSAGPSPVSGAAAASLLVKSLHDGAGIKVMIGGPGSRRGALASVLGDAYEAAYTPSGSALRTGRVVVINGSFVTETDSVFSILSGAFDGDTARKLEMSRFEATQQLGRQIYEQLCRDLLASGGDETPELTLIINGMERFIAHDGSALSAELDSLIRFVIGLEGLFKQWLETLQEEFEETKILGPTTPPISPVRLILIGTPRLLRYLSVVAPDHELIRIDSAGDGDKSTFTIAGSAFSVANQHYFARLEKQFPAASAPIGADPSTRRRSFLAQVFDCIGVDGSGLSDPDLAFEILKVLAFIGQPTEEHVLRHVPSLWTPGASCLTSPRRRRIGKAVSELIEKNLVLEIERFPTSKIRRLGLHKVLIMEIRQRYGVPVSDARLAAGFNIGLYTAQPVDSFTPDQMWHQDIGKMVDFLVGQYKDEQNLDGSIVAAAQALAARIKAGGALTSLRDLGAEQLARLAGPVMSDCLRAALSLMRSYYSTPALLMYGNRDLDPWNRDGPLSEHAERLMRLIRIAKIVAQVRREIGVELGMPAGDAQVELLLGPPPLYPDDLVWLHNELGVVRTTQGSLYGARAALEEASRLNDAFVDFGERHQNWRRISLNLIQSDIDGGHIERAEERIRDIETAIETEAEALGELPRQSAGGSHRSMRDYVIANYSHGDCSTRAGRVDTFYPTDLILGVALTLGYRGLCEHLRGALVQADESFKDAVAILERLNEQRAYAFFQRHRAALFADSGRLGDAKEALRLCVAAAGPSRQTDIDHSGRIALAQYFILIPIDGDRSARTTIIPQLAETLRYATSSDMFRLQLEAMQNMAAVHLHNGDADSAMQFATDALAIATRCGFGLRKVSLRILVGKILAFRSDRISARKLLLSASHIATRLHYERAVETAEDALVQLGYRTASPANRKSS